MARQNVYPNLCPSSPQSLTKESSGSWSSFHLARELPHQARIHRESPRWYDARLAASSAAYYGALVRRPSQQATRVSAAAARGRMRRGLSNHRGCVPLSLSLIFGSQSPPHQKACLLTAVGGHTPNPFQQSHLGAVGWTTLNSVIVHGRWYGLAPQAC